MQAHREKEEIKENERHRANCFNGMALSGESENRVRRFKKGWDLNVTDSVTTFLFKDPHQSLRNSLCR